MNTPPLFKHQTEIAKFIVDNRRALVFADPGTGKTAAILSAIVQCGTNAVVFCPKSIMVPAWVRDCERFTPQLKIAVATAPDKNREAAFKSGANVVVINHDGAKWLLKNRALLSRFNFLAIDESTAFKNRTTQRSKALAAIRQHFEYRVVMTGTPMSNGLLDVWHQVFLVDDGEHLGPRYFAFRAATHDQVPITQAISDWRPRAGAVEAVADMIAPICLRYTLEECIDIPDNSTSVRTIALASALRTHYREMERHALLAMEEGEIEAVNAAAQINKLLQIASGSVYGAQKSVYELGTERYDLIAELVNERTWPCVIGFQWKHQRDGLIQALQNAGIYNIAILDGDNNKDVDEVVTNFQAGKIRVLLAHPQTAGHGLTLTRSRTVIWASPTWNAELYEQLNRRIYRTGQTHKTETIIVAAEDTVDQQVVAKLTGKLNTQSSALDLLKALRPNTAFPEIA